MSTRDQDLAALRADFPGWEIWIVPRSTGGERWCARRHGDPLTSVLHADRPEHLAEYITEAEAER